LLSLQYPTQRLVFLEQKEPKRTSTVPVGCTITVSALFDGLCIISLDVVSCRGSFDNFRVMLHVSPIKIRDITTRMRESLFLVVIENYINIILAELIFI
jgi:hypothetical protein